MPFCLIMRSSVRTTVPPPSFAPLSNAFQRAQRPARTRHTTRDRSDRVESWLPEHSPLLQRTQESCLGSVCWTKPLSAIGEALIAGNDLGRRNLVDRTEVRYPAHS